MHGLAGLWQKANTLILRKWRYGPHGVKVGSSCVCFYTLALEKLYSQALFTTNGLFVMMVSNSYSSIHTVLLLCLWCWSVVISVLHSSVSFFSACCCSYAHVFSIEVWRYQLCFAIAASVWMYMVTVVIKSASRGGHRITLYSSDDCTNVNEMLNCMRRIRGVNECIFFSLRVSIIKYINGKKNM